MNLYHLRYFNKLAEMEHYTRASEELQITQPSLSHAISTLEEELGVKLFEKNGRNIQLTQNGQRFASQIQSALDIIDQATEDMQLLSKGAGHIRIGQLRTLSQQLVPALVRQFLRQNSDHQISFDFQSDTGMSVDIIDALIQKKYDIAFCSKISTPTEIAYLPVAKQELVLIVPKDHELAQRESIDLESTLNYPQIWFSQKSGIRPLIDQLFKGVKQAPHLAYQVEEDETIVGLVAEGFGIAVIPNSPILSLMNVQIIPLADVQSERTFYMAYLANAYQNPVLKNFIEFVETNNPYNF